MSVLQFMSPFQAVEVIVVGREDDVCFALVDTSLDGTEFNMYLLMERGTEARVLDVKGMGTFELEDPVACWERAQPWYVPLIESRDRLARLCQKGGTPSQAESLLLDQLNRFVDNVVTPQISTSDRGSG